MEARNRVGKGLSCRSSRLHRLSESIPWNLFLGSLKVYKYRLRTIYSEYPNNLRCCYIAVDPETRASKNGICLAQQMCHWSSFQKDTTAKDGSYQNVLFCHVMNVISFLMTGKLVRANSVLIFMRFRNCTVMQQHLIYNLSVQVKIREREKEYRVSCNILFILLVVYRSMACDVTNKFLMVWPIFLIFQGHLFHSQLWYYLSPWL
jgi:hypothetical protein